jgi:X-Pro dipeptidyl-peptidase
MKLTALIILFISSSIAFGQGSNFLTEEVYVESTTDTDSDGELDRIYISIRRSSSSKKLSTIMTMSPYSLGGNSTTPHDVDSDLLPQDESLFTNDNKRVSLIKSHKDFKNIKSVKAPITRIKYAKITAHSLGTGNSTGCPTVGDISEALGAKAVIDWLNGRAKAFDKSGKEIFATWANGKVGMSGVSYNGTLPVMVAATGVDGLKAIIPIAAISSWYNYYRANGLVVGPGGYIGEDADELGYYIVRKRACKKELEKLAIDMGREHGDYSQFWQDRDYISKANNIKAATFIIHGQSDWNVKQKHATELWKALGSTPKRMFLHKGGHGSTSSHKVPRKIQDWYDHFLEGVDNGITDGPQVEVELSNRTLITQNEWPSEKTTEKTFFFSNSKLISSAPLNKTQIKITDSGRDNKITSQLKDPSQKKKGRVIFLGDELTEDTLLSGTPNIRLELSVLNRKAANITVVIIEYTKSGKGKVITRGWADPQNYRDLELGEKLIPGKNYQMNFDLEPKQYLVSKGSKIGVMLASTDFNYTLRPKSGTQIQFSLDANSFIRMMLSK